MASVTGLDGLASPQSNYEKYKDMFTDNKHDLITMDNFYSLLVAEMQNQDPLEPTSNTEFISQMASFTALQAQQDAYDTQKQNYADSLVGKTVTVTSGDGEAITGTVDYVTHGSDPKVSVQGTQYALSSVSQVHDQGAQGASAIGDYGAFAASILGRTVVVQSVDSMGMTYIDEGTVSSLEIENGTVRVIVNGYAYNATEIVKVNGPEEQATASAAAEGPEEEEPVETVSAAATEEAASTQTRDNAGQTDTGVIETDEDDIEDIYELFE